MFDTPLVPVRRALLSVSDKTGLLDFARGLDALGISLISTGGTAHNLREAQLPVTEVSAMTGFPEIMDGRVKTLHPLVHGGLLGRRGTDDAVMSEHGIPAIDLLVANLYPFDAVTARPDCSLATAVENIDIGGPAMLRAAAKNHEHVIVISDPADYAEVLDALAHGGTSIEMRRRLAAKAYAHTAGYDGRIAGWLGARALGETSEPFAPSLHLSYERKQVLRYGENPHQDAAFYVEKHAAAGTLAHYTQLQGKELSYNNIADADAAWQCCRAFDVPACVIVKHANPCGVAIAETTLTAYLRALETDPTSAFGGIIAFNREVDGATAEAVSKQFVEVVLAPSISAAARKVFAAKQNVRLLEIPISPSVKDVDMKRVGGGLLVQSSDDFDVAQLKVVSKRKPTAEEMNDLLFAFRVCKHVKSNAIVFCRYGMTLGVGAGQMSRIDSTKIAAIKALNAGLSLKGSVAASDAFFPFRDGFDVIADAGATAVIQPGGSMRDDEVFAAADERNVAMVVTGMRHFRH